MNSTPPIGLASGAGKLRDKQCVKLTWSQVAACGGMSTSTRLSARALCAAAIAPIAALRAPFAPSCRSGNPFLKL